MKKHGRVHPTQSFASLVSASNRKALEPVVEEMVLAYTQQAQQKIAKQMIESLAGVQTRIMVLEKIAIEKLQETKTSLSERVLEVEDEATGHVRVDTPAQKGDLLRVGIKAKGSKSDEWSNTTNIVIHHLAERISEEVTYQTYKELEEALIGKIVGDVCDVSIHIPDQKEKQHLRIAVDRISRPKEIKK